MGEINGSFFYNGKPINGAMAKLWQKSVFTGTPPVFDQAEPGSGQQGATITTGTDYGGDGAFRWTGVPAGEYYVSCYYDNHRSWMYAAPSIEQIATTRGYTF